MNKDLPDVTHQQAHAKLSPRSSLASHLGRFDHGTTAEPRLQCYHGSSGPSVQESSHYTNHIRCHSSRGSQTGPGSCMEAPWSTGGSDQRPRDTVHIQLHLVLKSTSGDSSGSFHGLPPTEGRPN